MTTSTLPPTVQTRSMRKPRLISASHCVGIVSSCTDAAFTVDSGGVMLRGRRAVSCLLEPVVGDTVACVNVAPDEVWIVAVLMREEGAAHRLHLQGDTELDIGKGALRFTADTIEARSDAHTIRTRVLDVTSDEVQVVARDATLFGGALKVVGSVLDTVADRISQFSKHYLRTTEGTARVQAQVLEHQSSQLLHQSSENVVINGSRLVKARGGQIHFG